jgi:CubicO group peptidase (beta-lactamase class C family)
MTPWALVRIGSVSKIVTSVAVMKLVEEGRLTLSSRVFGPTGKDIER